MYLLSKGFECGCNIREKEKHTGEKTVGLSLKLPVIKSMCLKSDRPQRNVLAT